MPDHEHTYEESLRALDELFGGKDPSVPKRRCRKFASNTETAKRLQVCQPGLPWDFARKGLMRLQVSRQAYDGISPV
jgi:hypothetical protein